MFCLPLPCYMANCVKSARDASMYPDVRQLSQFYQSPLGRLAHAGIGRRLSAIWPEMRGRDVLAVGYGAPWASSWRTRARRVLLAMPDRQGVEQWPAQGGVKSLLVDPHALPFAENSFDRLLMVHCLEESPDPLQCLIQAGRVLAGNGRMVLVVAHRGSLWSSTSGTPFGHGRSFSTRQVCRLLDDAGFQLTARSQALFTPPFSWLARDASMEALEKTGSLFWPFFGGVLMLEAAKVRLVDPRNKSLQPVFRPEPA